ncbi:hypothetical protein DKP79_28130, partial [Klebsiella pneumoniae]|uniref:RHS repeat domain-containing protein n=1 Tax=Klebsiella pneumoniae TaxID=573 RepID=UPI000D929EC5
PATAARYIRISSNGSTSNIYNHIVEIEATYCVECAVSLAPTEGFEYDAVGNLTAETSRRGNTTTYEYDDLNRVVKQTDPQVDGAA